MHCREYDAAVPDDLYYSLQIKLEEAGKTELLGSYNVATILKTWDSFKGYPVVNVERDENGYLTLTQVSFSSSNQSQYPFSHQYPCLFLGKVFPNISHEQ